MTMPLADCRLIDLPKVPNVLGNLTFIEGERHVPFAIQRVYYLYDVPGGSERGGHAHRELQQLIIAMSGSFDVVLDDGYQQQRFHLNRSYQGLYVRTLIWRELDNFSSGVVCLALASEPYSEAGYYREYRDFLMAVDVFCGPSMVFTNVYNPRSAVSRKDEYRDTVVRRGATLGANCTMVCGVTIGEYAFVAAGAVINRDVPAYALMAGVPARRIGWMSQQGERLDLPLTGQSTATCPQTGRLYILNADRVTTAG